MLISEISVYEFLRDKVKLPDNEAKRYAKEFIIAEEKLHIEISNGISKELELKQVATKADIYALKSDIQSLETKMEKGYREIIIWVVSFMIATSGIAVAIIKLF